MRSLPSFGISGWSWLNALGAHAHRVGDAAPHYLLEERALRRQDLDLPGSWGRVAGALPPLPGQLARHKSRAAELLVAAVEPLAGQLAEVRRRYGSDRVAVILGSSTGGIDATEHALAVERRTGKMPDEFSFQEAHVYHALVRLLRELHGLEGIGFVISTACSSSGKALGAAQRLLSLGWADAVLTGGVDALCEMTVRGFAGLGILSSESCRPFDATRNGISIGEGAALLLLERESSSPFRLLGVGESSDAYHATAPHPEGLGARLAMERALRIADLPAARVGYVNAHGTGTEQNDQAEARALFDVFGPSVRYSSTKDRVGHQLGTAGATEALFCLHALQTQTLPENRQLDRLDATLAVQPQLTCIHGPFDVAQSNSFAFGGNNVSVLLGHDLERAASPEPTPLRLFVQAVSLWSPESPHLLAWLQNEAHAPEKPAAQMLPPRARGRASLLTRLFAELYQQLLGTEALEAEPALVLASAYGEMETTLALLDQLGVDRLLSPARFQASVHNTAAGLLALTTENRGFATALAAGPSSFAAAITEAAAWLSLHGGAAMVLVADETGPQRMLRGETFPALGVGVRLSAALEPPLGALAELGAPRLAGALEIPEVRSAYATAPAAWGVPFVESVALGRLGPLRLGPRTVAELLPVRR